MHNNNTASIRHEVTGLRKNVFQLRKERDVRDMIIAFYEHELNETMKDLDILHKVNMSLGAMIAVWVDQKKKG